MRSLKYWLLFCLIPFGMVPGLGAWLRHEDSPCGMSQAARRQLLARLGPGDAPSLRMSTSIMGPQCPDVFSYRQGGHLVQATAWDVLSLGLPRPPPRDEQACRFDGLSLPRDFRVLAAFAPVRLHSKLGIDADGTTEVTVKLDTRVPVVVMLLGGGPATWHVEPSVTTRLLGVFANGAHRQRIEGVDPRVPVFVSVQDEHGGCGWLFNSGAQDDVDATAMHLFGRAPDRTWRPGGGELRLTAE